MVALPGLASYSEDQLHFARSLSPAFKRYEALLSQLPPESLHFRRHRAWLECVLATYASPDSAEKVCAAWSECADQLLKATWRACGLEEQATLFALGKLGARELNLSSDIDLLVIAEGADKAGVEKKLRRFQAELHVAGAFGFCFRLDFDLRPGGKMGPWVTTPEQFQDYYWSQGETWERLAFVRLRQIAGRESLGESIRALAKRFSYRKFLDFTLLEDLKALRLKIHQTGFERSGRELHLKLEVGGIRDIELFVHSLLILNGGKIPELQTVSTSQALEQLKSKALLPASEADFLRSTYWRYRYVENLVQSLEDRQTHALAENQPPPLPPLSEIQSTMAQVDGIVSSLLGNLDLTRAHLPAGEDNQHQWLSALGFSVSVVQKTWPLLMQATALSHKNDRDERARQEFLFQFVNELAAQTHLDRDLGLNLLLDLVRATRAKATFFSMLLRSPRLIRDLARLFCLSPYLGSIVASRPELLDHFILQVDEGWAQEPEALLQQMSERKLLTELWSANQYLEDRELNAMFDRISQTADSICTQLLTHLKSEHAGSSLQILTVGKWAGRELGLRSDLDFVFVTSEPPNDRDFKVARRFISRLTDPSKGGNLYDLDLRLRPSGQSGPILVERAKLEDYWQTSAAPWERQAYLRARPLGSELKLRKELLVLTPLAAPEQNELAEIRKKLLRPEDDGLLDLKYAPGGLLDIEFTTQIAWLRRGELPQGLSTETMLRELNWGSAGQELETLYARLRTFEQMLQLSSSFKTTEAKRSSENFNKTSSLLRLTADGAWLELKSLVERARSLLLQLS